MDNVEQQPAPKLDTEAGLVEQGLKACCVETIEQHALYNPMMVCGGCKQIIKCFSDERSFRNYLTFCKGRRRKVQTGVVQDYHTIVFQSYENYR